MRTNIYLTIDTESSMGGAWQDLSLHPVGADQRIYCLIGGKSYGIGWICQELNKRQLKATFFAEVFGSLVFGEDETRRWIQYLLDRGQDVELHTHTNFYFFSQYIANARRNARCEDNLVDIEAPLGDELLDRACEIFRQTAGYDPIAYRAGNWRVNRALLRSLKAKGIVVDASFNPVLPGSGYFDERPDLVNCLHLVEGVWELPVTVAHQRLPKNSTADGWHAVDPTSMSRWELRKVLDDSHASKATHISIIFHSFSGVKAKNQQYTDMKPDRIVRRRFEFLLDYLAENQDRFHVTTVGELARQLQSPTASVEPHASITRLGLLHPLARKIIQGVNSVYF